MKAELHLVLGIALAAVVWSGCRGQGSGPAHVFSVDPVPPFLTEELAVAKARETLELEGYRLSDWQITRAYNPPSEAPDGTPDEYFDRFSFRPNAGRVHFIQGSVYRTYDVRLEGDRLICSVFRGL